MAQRLLPRIITIIITTTATIVIMTIIIINNTKLIKETTGCKKLGKLIRNLRKTS